MNEELQSTNEELETINDELRQRTDELNEVNGFLEAILVSLESAVVVVNRELRVLVWNEQAQDLWGLRSDEVEGEHFMNVDIGLPVDQLLQPIRNAFADGGGRDELTLKAVNRRGRPVICTITTRPLRRGDELLGAILLMETTEDGA
jgi:two-component system CheB/CheR fusion protein